MSTNTVSSGIKVRILKQELHYHHGNLWSKIICFSFPETWRLSDVAKEHPRPSFASCAVGDHGEATLTAYQTFGSLDRTRAPW